MQNSKMSAKADNISYKQVSNPVFYNANIKHTSPSNCQRGNFGQIPKVLNEVCTFKFADQHKSGIVIVDVGIVSTWNRAHS